MNKNLPRVYANKNINNKNNQAESRLNKREELNIDDIFDDSKYTFKRKYLITLNNNNVIESSIISRQHNNLITIDGDIIDIANVKSIVEIKK